MRTRSRILCACFALLGVFAEAPGYLSGHVTGLSGKSARYVDITVSGPVTKTVTTGRDGKFAFSLPPGRYDLLAESDAAAPFRKKITMESGQRMELEIAMVKRTAAAGYIVGVVVNTAGRPVSRVDVSYSGSPRVITTKENGRFVFRDVEPGRYTLTVNAFFGTITKDVTVQAGETLDLGEIRVR